MSGPRQVGEFINLKGRPIIKSVRNPLDISTVVNMFPKELKIRKETIHPSRYIIPAGSIGEPSLTKVGGASWWKDNGPDQPILEITISSIMVAEAIIRDYCTGLTACNMTDTMPAMFYVLGEISPVELKIKHSDMIRSLASKQNNWYAALERLGDSLWARTNGNPLSISDEMRLAARELDHNDKPWLQSFVVGELIRCIACGGMRNPVYPVCPTCKNIDPAHPDSKNLKFAM